MLQYTDKARDWIATIIAQQPEPDYCVRLEITGRGASGFQYDMGLVKVDDAKPEDTIVDNGNFRTLVDAKSVQSLTGATVDLVEQLGQASLKIDNPNPLWSDPVALAVQKILDDEVNPGVAGHGGWVQLLDVRDGIAYIQMGGGCHGCGMSQVTLKQGVETAIQRSIPAIRKVLDTTDHAAGTNPYYRASGASPFA